MIFVCCINELLIVKKIINTQIYLRLDILNLIKLLNLIFNNRNQTQDLLIINSYLIQLINFLTMLTCNLKILQVAIVINFFDY